MASEHDDDMAREVDEGATGETDAYAVVNEDVEQRGEEEADSQRLKKMQENLHKAEGDEVE
jgi:hypothetical protein